MRGAAQRGQATFAFIDWIGQQIVSCETDKLDRYPERTLESWRHRGEGPAWLRAGKKSVRYARADIEIWHARIWKEATPVAVSHFHAEISLQAIEKSLFEDTANKAQEAESRPEFAFYGCGSATKAAESLYFPCRTGKLTGARLAPNYVISHEADDQLKYHDNQRRIF